MRRNRSKSKKIYYVALNRSSNEVVVVPTKAAVCEFLGISVDTLRRRIKDKSAYHCEEYSVWSGVTIPAIQRGFRIKRYCRSISYE